MPISAMPPHLNTPEKIDAAFPDDEQFGTTSWWGRLYRWYNKTTKTWFAFSYRCTEWWARWRKYPKVLFALKSKDGYFRIETPRSDGTSADCAYDARYLVNEVVYHIDNINPYVDVISEGYLSRIQYWCRWHFAVQWPLLFSFHYYFHAKDVPEYGKPRPKLKGKLLYFYWNHFDADLIYWMVTSAFIGTTFK
jgi:hypothetical protein